VRVLLSLVAAVGLTYCTFLICSLLRDFDFSLF